MQTSSSKKGPPYSIYDERRHVGVGDNRVSNVSNPEFPGHYHGEENAWDLTKFKQVRSNRQIIFRLAKRQLFVKLTPGCKDRDFS
jgi:hypothetical protein